jgi:GTP-dependent phosphoenolpyruvate carboxykinase
MTERCKQKVFKGFRYYPCQNKATKDGYCGTHHPDAVARRKERTRIAYEQKESRSIYSQWRRMRDHNKELKGLVKVAYMEGWLDGERAGSIEEDWGESNTKKKLEVNDEI